MNNLNDVLATRQRVGDVVVLDRSTGLWGSVILPKEFFPHVLGFDGEILVTDTANGRVSRFRLQH